MPLDEASIRRLASTHLSEKQARVFLLYHYGDDVLPENSTVRRMSQHLSMSGPTLYKHLKAAQCLMKPHIEEAAKEARYLPTVPEPEGTLRFKIAVSEGHRGFNAHDSTQAEALRELVKD